MNCAVFGAAAKEPATKAALVPDFSTPANAAEYKALDKRAGELIGCCENSQEEAELEAIADAMDAYDTMARLWGRQALKLAGSDDTGLPCMQLLAFGFGQLR